MIDLPTIHDRFVDDLATFGVPNITIKLSPEAGMSHDDFRLLIQSASIRHPNLHLTALRSD